MALIEIPKSHLAKTISLAPFVIKRTKKAGFIKKAAFTLAEILITLTIIGVIAALTIPTLISKYQKQTYVTGLKKAYSVISNAVKMMPITEGCSPGDYKCVGSLDSENMLNLLEKQLKVVKRCNETNAEECIDVKAIEEMPWCYKSLCYGKPFLTESIVTEDGMAFSSSYGIHVDINGKKGPNKMGRDIFVFHVAEEYSGNIPPGTVTPMGSKALYYDYWNENPSNPGCNGKDEQTMDLCAGRVLEEDAMNY